MASAIASCVSGLRDVASMSSNAEREKVFSSDQMASRDLPDSRHKCKIIIMMIIVYKHYLFHINYTLIATRGSSKVFKILSIVNTIILSYRLYIILAIAIYINIESSEKNLSVIIIQF